MIFNKSYRLNDIAIRDEAELEELKKVMKKHIEKEILAEASSHMQNIGLLRIVSRKLDRSDMAEVISHLTLPETLCKDCYYYEPDEYHLGLCKRCHEYFYTDDFCSKGVRRENADNETD